MSIPISSPSATQGQPEVVYPESDGRPMGETGFHVEALVLLHQGLKSHLAAIGRTDSYVASNMFLYYEEGNPKANRSPDLMVILGVDGHQRRTFKTWVERAVPAVIFEISSDETWREDVRNKRDLYARLGVAEYFLFDPLGDCLDPRFQGLCLQGNTYVPLIPAADGGLESLQLGLRLVPEEEMIRLINAATGEPILTGDEKTDRLEQERARREHEQKRAEREKQRAEREKKRAEREKQRAEQERSRAATLEAEVARLRALLDQQEKKD